MIMLTFLLIGSVGFRASADLVITNVQDLNQNGVVVAVQSGTTSDLYAQANLTKATVTAFDSFDKAVGAVTQKDAHVLLGDYPVLAYYAVDNPNAGLKIAGKFGDKELFGIGVRQDSTELLDALNAALYAIIQSGKYDTIYSNWFSGDVILTDDSTASTATTFPANTSGSDLTAVLNAGKLVFGSDTTYPPFEFLDGGSVTGFDAAIGAALATELSSHYNVQVQSVMQTNAWSSIIPDLQGGTFDAILSAMTKTPERAQQISFTRSYYTSQQGILQGEKTFTTSSTGGLPISLLPAVFALMAIPIIRRKN